MFGIRPEEIAGAGEFFSRGSAAGLDSSSAMVRAEAGHLDATLHALVTRLRSVPGLNMSVTYQHGKLRRFFGDLPYINDLNRKTGPIQRIVIVVDPYSYWLRSDGDTLRCGRAAITTGPDENEQLSFSVWAKTLFEEIARQNTTNHDSLVALRQLVEHDRVD